MKRHCLAAVAAAWAATALTAGTISIPSTTVNGTDVFSGPTITLTSTVLPTDTLTLTASGEVFLQTGNTYGTNAAGVVTTAGSTGVGGTMLNGSTNFGALLLGNSTFGFHQLFPANAANGLGSPTPPSLLTLTSVPLSSLGFSSTMPGSTVLEFRISDTNTIDNSGSFTVSGEFNTAAAEVPEPSTVVFVMAGLAGLVVRRLFSHHT